MVRASLDANSQDRSLLNTDTTMGLFDYLKTQFIEIIQWEDDSRDTLSWRFPDSDKEIKRGAQLIVRPGQMAVFVHQGRIADVFGPVTSHFDSNQMADRG